MLAIASGIAADSVSRGVWWMRNHSVGGASMGADIIGDGQRVAI